MPLCPCCSMLVVVMIKEHSMALLYYSGTSFLTSFLNLQTWLIYPHRRDIWRIDEENTLVVYKAFNEVIRSISRFEQVAVLVNEVTKPIAVSALSDISNIGIYIYQLLQIKGKISLSYLFHMQYRIHRRRFR